MDEFELKKHRKEVHLTHEIIIDLEKKASAAGRSLKNYMEAILIADADTELSKKVIK